MKVEKGTAADLADILRWLKVEHDQDGGEGFWCNREVIRSSLKEGNLWVIREGGQAIAFQVGDYSPDILNVRKDKQRQGYGTVLFEASLARAIRDNVNVLKVECYPPTSLTFWDKHGLERYGDLREGGKVTVRLVLTREFDISSELPQVEVAIGFYPEAVLYNNGVPPTSAFLIKGAKQPDGSIQLARRAVGLEGDRTQNGDLVTRIEIDSVEICYCKAKHIDAQQAGVVRDPHQGGVFCIDTIPPLVR